jgi:hypothetical protein
MGKDKEPAKKVIVPSTTRRGTNLPSRPHFSPNAATTPASKNKFIAQISSPLSIMSTSNEKDLLDVDKDKECTPNLSKSMFDEHMESEFEDGELYNEKDNSLSPKISNNKEDGIFNKAFMNVKLDDLDEFEASLSSCLDDLFLDARKVEAPVIYIKDKDYEFNVETKKIERAEDIKFNGMEDELPWEQLINLSELANVFGNTKIQKRYYFLKLFPFSLGGEEEDWYNYLAPKSITSKKACIYLFCNKYFPASKWWKKLFTFLKVKKKAFLKLGGDLVPSRGSVQPMV